MFASADPAPDTIEIPARGAGEMDRDGRGHRASTRLAIVCGLVTQAGGTVRLDSAPGIGTTATVLLRLIAVEELDR